MARARPDQLVEEMMTELQTVESMNCTIERTETPPFFRITSLRKTSNHSGMYHVLCCIRVKYIVYFLSYVSYTVGCYF